MPLPPRASATALTAVLGIAMSLAFAATGCAPRGPAGPAAGPREAADGRARRYLRDIALPLRAEGTACVALVPEVYERAASAALTDLSIFAVNADGERKAMPFSMTENGTEPGIVETAGVSGLTASGNEIDFSLDMPQRLYSAVDLDLRLKDFIGTAAVTGVSAQGASTWLGDHVVFDESSKGLGRSTRMELAEERFPSLHVKLRLSNLNGQKWTGDLHGAVGPADVPRSREAQTLYATVARTNVLSEAGMEGSLVAPAHVPIERVTLETGGSEDFLREVSVRAGEDMVRGTVEREHLPARGSTAIVYQRLSVPAVLAANLRRAAEVHVKVSGPSLPVRAVALEMRQRKLCFPAGHGARYELAYGGQTSEGVDTPSAAPEPVGEAFTPMSAPIIEAVLGPEHPDTSYVAPTRWQLWLARQPELLWIVALAAVAVLAAQMRLQMRRR